MFAVRPKRTSCLLVAGGVRPVGGVRVADPT